MRPKNEPFFFGWSGDSRCEASSRMSSTGADLAAMRPPAPKCRKIKAPRAGVWDDAVRREALRYEF